MTSHFEKQLRVTSLHIEEVENGWVVQIGAADPYSRGPQKRYIYKTFEELTKELRGIVEAAND